MSERSRRLRAALFAYALAATPAWAQEPESFDCLIEPSSVVEVASPNAGVLAEVAVERGDRVRLGTVVARLQSDVERATVDLARKRASLVAAIAAATARIEFEKSEVGRQRGLRASEHLSARELEESETQLRLAELQLDELKENRELARLELRRTEVLLDVRSVKSPIDGVVVERYRVAGEYVEDQPILRLAAVVPLHVEVVLPVPKLGKVKVGDLAEVRPEDPPGGVYQAPVTVVDAVVDAATSTFRVRAELPNADGALPAGLRCQLRFLDVLPSSARTAPPRELQDTP